MGQRRGLVRKRPLAGRGAGLIFITLADELDPVGDRLAELCDRFANWKMSELVGFNPSTMDAGFNWKIQLETGMECYHHFAAHPGTFEVDFPTRLSWCEDSRSGWDVCHSPARDEAPDDVYTMGLPAMPGLTAEERRVFDLYLIFPLTRLAVHPDRITLRLLTPVGPRRTTSKRITLVRPEVAAQPELLAEEFALREPFSHQGDHRGQCHRPNAADRRRLEARPPGPPQPPRGDGVAPCRIRPIAHRHVMRNLMPSGESA